MPKTAPTPAAADPAQLLQSLYGVPETLTELLALHPGVPRHTAQRWLAQWVAQGLVVAQGEARARR